VVNTDRKEAMSEINAVNGVAYPVEVRGVRGDDVDQLTQYDFDEAFSYAGSPNVVPPGEPRCGGHGFDLDAVDYIDVLWGESVEGYAQIDVLAIGKLKDGRWFSLSAGCDTTGWDCQAWGDASVATSLDNIVRFGLDDRDRERLGVGFDV
jgi:hypothetical protein